MNKVKKASLVPGPAYLHIYSPCPTGWRCGIEESVEMARLAVQSKVFPLFEVIDGPALPFPQGGQTQADHRVFQTPAAVPSPARGRSGQDSGES